MYDTVYVFFMFNVNLKSFKMSLMLVFMLLHMCHMSKVFARFMEYGNVEEISLDCLFPCGLFANILKKIPPQVQASSINPKFLLQCMLKLTLFAICSVFVFI